MSGHVLVVSGQVVVVSGQVVVVSGHAGAVSPLASMCNLVLRALGVHAGLCFWVELQVLMSHLTRKSPVVCSGWDLVSVN